MKISGDALRSWARRANVAASFGRSREWIVPNSSTACRALVGCIGPIKFKSNFNQKRIEGLDFELKIHTNITRDHLDYHKTVEEYIAVKNSFFADESKKLINKDDTNIRFNSKNCLTYALDAPSTYKVDAFSFKEETHVLMNNLSSMYAYTSNLMGVFNIYNITAAVAAVHMLTKRDLEEICEVVEDFAGVSGRMEIISKDPFIIIDFAHTPDGMNEVLKSFSHKDIIVVFGAGGDRDKEKRAIMGKVASQWPDMLENDGVLAIAN